MKNYLKEHSAELVTEVLQAVDYILEHKDRITKFCLGCDESLNMSRHSIPLDVGGPTVMFISGAGWCLNVNLILCAKRGVKELSFGDHKKVSVLLNNYNAALGWSTAHPVRSPNPDKPNSLAYAGALAKPRLMWGEGPYADNRWAQLQELRDYLAKTLELREE